MAQQNPDESFYAARLIIKYLRDELTGREREELENWRLASQDNQLLFEDLTHPDELEDELDEFNKTDTEKGWQRVLDKIALKLKDKNGRSH